MELRRVGHSGLEVSHLALGTMTWGRDTDADEAATELETFVAAGGTLIDTANVFGDGDAEAIIGTLVPDVISRDALQIAVTTVGVGGGRGPVLRALDGSLARLGTDHIDLWQVHAFDANIPFAETCAALEYAVSTGRTRYVGISGVRAWQLATYATALRSRHAPIVSVETEYSLLERTAEKALFEAARTHGVGILGWAPLARGVLTGKYRHGTPSDSRGASEYFARYVGRHRHEGSQRVVDAVTTAADGLATSPLAVALAWARDRPGVSSTILGARNNAQLVGALVSEQIVLPPEICRALDDVSGDGATENQASN